jgi:hypothetical protein
MNTCLEGYRTNVLPLDNVPRANRVQQLVDSVANMQTDIQHNAVEMDKSNAKIRPLVDQMLRANGMDGPDDLIEKAKAKMTDAEKQQFEKVSFAL